MGRIFSKAKKRKIKNLCQILPPKQRRLSRSGLSGQRQIIRAGAVGHKGRHGDPDQGGAGAQTQGDPQINEVVDDSIVIELEKEGFIDRIYKQ
ncbi:MAG TPA: hypothetical protein VIH18_33355 [Candidatus Binatia bacterium]|jgi:hypothetical protein